MPSSRRYRAKSREGTAPQRLEEQIGRLFEQSVPEADRKQAGVYYTPAHLTDYLVEETLGRTLRERWDGILAQLAPTAVTDSRQQQERWVAVWEAYAAALSGLRILDPACGAGAFLLAAYERLAREYQRAYDSLVQLGGEPPLAEAPPRMILRHNLLGIDISQEAVELTRLSLWLKAGGSGEPPAELGRNICRGNSVVDDATVDAAALDWQSAPWRDGFDIVLGNPPYVRHELLGPCKEHWARTFRVYHGAADLFVYFFERGLAVLRPGGRLGFLVANKWLRAEYGRPLRELLAARARLELLVDFGHAPVFLDADTFPCVLTLVKDRDTAVASGSLAVARLLRAQSAAPSLAECVRQQQYEVPQRRLGSHSWSLEPPACEALLHKLRAAGLPLAEYAGVKPYRGIVTGCNAAFLIDSATHERLLRADPGSADLCKRYLRGQDVARWQGAWNGQWMIFARRGIDIDRYPAIREHLQQFHAALLPRPAGAARNSGGRKSGRYQWFELQDTSAYFPLFARPKIVYQEIQFHPSYALDEQGLFLNNKAFFLPTGDLWLLAVLNSPLLWWHNWRALPHMKDDALSPTGRKVAALPIATPTAATRAAAEDLVRRLLSLAHSLSGSRRVAPAPAVVHLERELAALVNTAYDLSAAEVTLVEKTAPPRMPPGFP